MTEGVTRDAPAAVTRDGSAADRQARFKASLAGRGVGQVNLMAPTEAHAALKEIARRTRAGELLSFVLDSVATKARLAGKPKDTADLGKVLDKQPAPEPGKVLVAVKLTNAATGADRKKVARLGLAHIGGKMTGRGGAFVGAVPEPSLEAARALIEKTGGRMEVRRQD